MLFREGELKLLWPFYVFFLIYGLSGMIFPFMIIYFVDIGLSFTQIGIITAAYGVAAFLFELPTGTFADRYGRKRSVLLGFLITGLAVMAIPLTQSFWLLLGLWSLAGIGMTFNSGAEDAWVIDNLSDVGREELTQEYYIKAGSITAAGAVFAPLIGAFIVRSQPIGVLWYIFGAGFLVSMLVLAVFAREEYVPGAEEGDGFEDVRKGLLFAFVHRPILLLIIAGVLVQLTIAAGNAEQPFLTGLGMADHQLGYLYAVISLVVVFTPYFARLVSSPRRALRIITPFLTVFSVPLLFIGYPNFLYAAILSVLGAVIFSLYLPIHFTYFQSVVPKRVRARVTSASSMVLQLAYAIMTVVAGLLMDIFELRFVLVGFSLFALAAWYVYGLVPEDAPVQE